jgi:mutator protein MutT
LSPGASTSQPIHVVAAAVIRGDGRVLIAQRPAGKHLAGGWEFPGGKLERGESRSSGLARELREELGIAIFQPRPLIRVRHAYPQGEVLIDMWVVTRYQGEPRGLDGQALQWRSFDELGSAGLLPADRPIVRVLSLPERLTAQSTAHCEVIGALDDAADRHIRAGASSKLLGLSCSTVEEAAQAAHSGRFDLLVMRSRLPEADLHDLCDRVPIPVYAVGITLEAAWALGATGVSGFETCARHGKT